MKFFAINSLHRFKMLISINIIKLFNLWYYVLWLRIVF